MGDETRALLAGMRAGRREHFERLAGLPEERLTNPAPWGGREVDARFILLRLADHEEEHALQVQKTLDRFGWRQSEAQQILGAAQVTRGDLLGALVGLSDADIDIAPEGEWPLRLILWHIAQTDRSYTANILWAAELARAGREWGPMEPIERLPEEGDLAAFVDRLDDTRDRLLDALAGIEDAVMTAPTVWFEIRVDLRFRLMRVAHHEREHSAHLLKWRDQVGQPFTDAQRLLANAWRARGVLESLLVGLPDELLDRDPANGDGTLRAVLEHVQRTEPLLARRALGEA